MYGPLHLFGYWTLNKHYYYFFFVSHYRPSHLFTEGYLFVAAPLLIVLATGVFIHYSTVRLPLEDVRVQETGMNSLLSFFMVN